MPVESWRDRQGVSKDLRRHIGVAGRVGDPQGNACADGLVGNWREHRRVIERDLVERCQARFVGGMGGRRPFPNKSTRAKLVRAMIDRSGSNSLCPMKSNR